MNNMHNHPDKAASYIMFDNDDCPYCLIAELEQQNAKLVEALEDVKCIATPPDRLDSGVKLDSIYDIAAAALKEVENE